MRGFYNPTHIKRESTSEVGLQTSRPAEEGSVKISGRYTHPASCGFYVPRDGKAEFLFYKATVHCTQVRWAVNLYYICFRFAIILDSDDSHKFIFGSIFIISGIANMKFIPCS